MNPFQRARDEASVARTKLLGLRANEAVHVKEFLTTGPVEKAFNLSVHPVARGTTELPSGDANLRREDDAIYVWKEKDEVERAYLVAHELGHFHLDDEKAANTLADLAKALGPEGQSKASVSVEAYGARERNELRANVFARELLLPRAVARRMHEQGIGAREGAAKYGIHIEVVRQQMLDGILLPVVTKPAKPRPTHPLSPDQEAAAHAAEQYANVVAGPGSGKTKTLVDRVRYLIEVKKIEPRHILVLTFTNKAALELIDRLRDAGIERASDIWAGTFHAFGLEFLRKYHQHVNLENDVVVVDKLGSIVMLNRDLANVSLTYYKRLQDPYEWLPKVVEAIKRLKEEMLSPGDYRNAIATLAGSDPQAKLRREDVATLFERHELLLAKRQMVDFVDLVAKPAAELKSDRAKYSEFADRFKHVLVDEYQDVTQAMVQLIVQLAKKKKTVWVVGDVRQAIHHWRGASVQSLRKFGSAFGTQGASKLNLQTYPLTYNRRSTPQIVKVIDQVGTRHVLQRDPLLELTKAKATNANGPQPRLLTCEPGSSMPEAIASEIKASKYEYSDQVVLARANHEVERLALELRQRGVPTLYIGELAQRAEVKVLLCLMHLLVERSPRALVGLMSIPDLAIDGADVPKLMQACEDEPNLQVGRWMHKPPAGLTKRTIDAISRVRTVIGDHTLSSTPWSFTCDMILERRFGYPPLADQSIEAHAARIGLWQFAYSSRVGDGESKVLRLVRFLHRQQLRRRINETYAERELPPEAVGLDAVRMMTVHASKGLEFEVVHLANAKKDDYAEDGKAWQGPPDILTLVPPPVLKSTDAEWQREAATERNNLLYVAVSRAMNDLVIYQDGDDKRKFVEQLNKLPSACAIRTFHGKADAAKAASSKAPSSKLPPMTLNELETYARCPLQHWYRYRLDLPPESFTDVSLRARMAVMAALEEFARGGTAKDQAFKKGWEAKKLPVKAVDPQLHEHALELFDAGVALIQASAGEYHVGVADVNGLQIKLPWTLRTGGPVVELEAIEFFFSKPRARDATWRPVLFGLAPNGGDEATVHSLLTGAQHVTTPSADVTLTGLYKAVDRLRNGVQTPSPGKPCRYCPYATVCPSRPSH